MARDSDTFRRAVSSVLAYMPLTPDLSAWYSHATVLSLAAVLGLTGWGFYVSLAGRPLFVDELTEG